jgi:hypothetical protein
VFAISNNKISSSGDWTKMSSSSVTAKTDFAEQQKVAIREHEESLRDIDTQIANLEKRGKQKHKHEIEGLHAKHLEIKGLIAQLLNIRIGFEMNDDDHDCEHESRKIVTIDLLKKWREFAISATKRIGQCHSDAKSIFDKAIAKANSTSSPLTSNQNQRPAVSSFIGSLLNNLFVKK